MQTFSFFFFTKIWNYKLLSSVLFCFGLAFKELVFPWGNTGSRTKPVNTRWFLDKAGWWWDLRGSERIRRQPVLPGKSQRWLWGSRSNFEHQECKSALLYVTVPLLVSVGRPGPGWLFVRGHPSRLSVGPGRGDRVQLILDMHMLVSAEEGGSDEIFHSGFLGKNDSSTIETNS